ncbi:hypothetical protein M3Y99_01823600 [Aphelenchoides fujianensis]|nr:hypothetical protein M3Y99_01823600 [Aphelenchoides fujianensis]
MQSLVGAMDALNLRERAECLEEEARSIGKQAVRLTEDARSLREEARRLRGEALIFRTEAKRLGFDRREVKRLNKEKAVQMLLDDIGGVDEHARYITSILSPLGSKRVVHRYLAECQEDHGFRLQVVQAFKIDSKRDLAFDLHVGNITLWHGTATNNVYDILKNGFRSAVASESAMFGRGVYWANCVSKAAQYCGYRSSKVMGDEIDGMAQPDANFGYLFLSEVALGRPNVYSKAQPEAKLLLNGADSVHGLGSSRPSGMRSITGVGAQVKVPIGPLKRVDDLPLRYDEFVVFRSTQIRHRYLVKVKIIPK